MFSGLWLTAAFAIAGLVTSLADAAALAAVVFLANRTVALYHSWSTIQVVLFSNVLKADRRKNRVRYFYWPVGIVGGSMALGYLVSQYQWFGEHGQLTGDLWLWILYISLFWVGHFWHFGNQDFGVLSFYRMRAGQIAETDRKRDKLYATAMMLIIQPIIFVRVLGPKGNPFSEIVHTFVPFAAAAVEALAAPALATAVALTTYVVAVELRNPAASLPKVLYYTVMLFHPAFLFFAGEGFGPLYVASYLWSHWLIATGLVTYMGVNYRARAYRQGPMAALFSHLAVLSLFVIPVIWLTKGFAEYSLFDKGGLDVRVTLASIDSATHWIAGFFLGFFLGEQLLHYYCDRVLFRFRDEAIRKSVAPLFAPVRLAQTSPSSAESSSSSPGPPRPYLSTR